MEIKSWVHQLDEVVEGEELDPHARLVTEEVALLEID